MLLVMMAVFLLLFVVGGGSRLRHQQRRFSRNKIREGGGVVQEGRGEGGWMGTCQALRSI